MNAGTNPARCYMNECSSRLTVWPLPSKQVIASSTLACCTVTTPWTLSDFQTVANKYGRNVVQITLGDSYCQANGTEEYLNRSYVSFPNIYLGIYDDEEFKLASFFHELGHVLVPEEFIESVKYYTPDVEREVWRLGFELAKNEHGLEFSKKVHEWVDEQIQTYVEGWERERKFVEELRKHQIQRSSNGHEERSRNRRGAHKYPRP